MKIAENISWKQLQDKVVAVNLTTGTYYTMNVVASSIWNLIAEGKNAEDIAEALSEEYDQSPKTILDDIKEQIGYWTKEQLIITE